MAVWDALSGLATPGQMLDQENSGIGTQLYDTVPNFRDRFNTPLNAAQTKQYHEWLGKLSKARGYDASEDLADYDMQGAFLSGAQPNARGHFTDEFKKPNHPTFSTESKYSGHGNGVGGKWIEGQNGQWSYAASPENMEYRTPQDLTNYFATREPTSPLTMPAQEQTPVAQSQDQNPDPGLAGFIFGPKGNHTGNLWASQPGATLLRAAYHGLFGDGDATVQAPQQSPAGIPQLQPMQQSAGQQGVGTAAPGGSVQFTLPSLGPQAQMPNAPHYQGANFGGAINTLERAAPQAPDLSVYGNVPQRAAPVKPDTSGDEEYLKTLQGLAPEAPDQSKRKQENLVSILGALAAGSQHTNGSTASTLAGAGAAGAHAFVENSLRDAAEDRRFKSDQLAYGHAVMEAKDSLAAQHQQYQEAVNATRYGNDVQRHQAALQAEAAQERFEASQRQFAGQIAGLQARAAESHASAVNQSMNAQFRRDVEQMHIDGQNSGYKIEGGNIIAHVKNSDGSMTIKSTPLPGANNKTYLDGLGAQFKLGDQLDKAGLGPAAHSVRAMAGMSRALHDNNPTAALNAAAFSMLPEAQKYLGDDYPKELDKIKAEATQQGVLQGTKEYGKFVDTQMQAYLAKTMAVDPRKIQAVAGDDPMAAIVASKFLGQGGSNGKQ